MTEKLSGLNKGGMLLGNLFEHYDDALFNLLTPFLAPFFFPGQDYLTALILTYCLSPLGLIARPIGSLIFGYIGDTRGRKEALEFSLIGMAVITALIGFIPTYSQAGVLATILLALGRIFQNFFASGNSIGGAIYLVENSPPSEKDIVSSFFNASSVAGILLASLGVSVLCFLNVVHEGWRYLYVFGCLTALFAAFLRTKSFDMQRSAKTKSETSIQFIIKTCWDHRKVLITIAIASGFSYASYSLSLIVMNGLVPLISSVSKMEMMHLNTILLTLDLALLPIFGYLASLFSREKMMIIAGIVAVLTGAPLFWFLEGASFFMIILIRIFLIVIGVWFCAPFHSWSQNLVSPPYRYTVISFAYAVGTQLLGAPTAAISLWLFQKTHWIVSAGWYWMLLGFLSSYLIARQEAPEHEHAEMVSIKT